MKVLIVLAAYLVAVNADFSSTFGEYEKKINCEINKQIEVELMGHYTYLKLSHKFNDKSTYYPKVAKYFRAKADEEMQHAERFIQYQNQRGGKFELTGVSIAGNLVQDCNDFSSLQPAFTCAQNLEIYVTKKLTNLANLALDVKDSNTQQQCKASATTSTSANENALIKGQSVLVTLKKNGYDDEVKSLNDLTYDTGSTTTTVNNGYTINTVKYIELAEMITHEFLGHQIEDTKEIANYVETLTNLNKDKSQGNLGSYLFDKHLPLED